MFLNKFLLIGSGVAIAGGGAGVGIYYAVNNEAALETGKTKAAKPSMTVSPDRSGPEEPVASGLPGSTGSGRAA